MASKTETRKTQRVMLKVQELADLIGRSRQKAYLMVKAKEIPSVLIGGMVRIPRNAIEKLINVSIGE
jgi:excisionase family DNA binding protein